MVVAGSGRGKEQAVDLLLPEGLKQPPFPLGALPGVTEDQLIAALEGRITDGPCKSREEGILDIGDNEGEESGSATAEASSNSMFRIPELRDSGEHASPCFRAHETRAIEHVGDGSRGDARKAGNILNARPHGNSPWSEVIDCVIDYPHHSGNCGGCQRFVLVGLAQRVVETNPNLLGRMALRPQPLVVRVAAAVGLVQAQELEGAANGIRCRGQVPAGHQHVVSPTAVLPLRKPLVSRIPTQQERGKPPGKMGVDETTIEPRRLPYVMVPSRPGW